MLELYNMCSIVVLERRRKNMSKLLDTEELADFFGVNKDTIRRWKEQEGMPFIKIKGALRFDPEEIKEWARKTYQ